MLGSKGAVRAAARVVVVVALLVGGLAGSRAEAQELPTDPGDLLDLLLQLIGEAAPDDLPDPIDVLDPLNPACDQLEPSRCLFPFPSDRWTVSDPAPATGRRVALPLLAMPRNVYGKPIDPTEWNRNDGLDRKSTSLNSSH